MGAPGAKTGLRPLARPVDVYNDLADRKIAVDASIILYKLAYVYRKQCDQGDYTAVVRTFWRRICRFLAAGVSVLPVFDGAALEGKASELDRRHQRRCRAVAAAMKAKDDDALLKAGVTLPDELISAVQAKCYEEGLGFLVAPYEADPQLAHELRCGHVWAVLSEDSDLLIHGAGRVIMDFVPSTGMAVMYDFSLLEGSVASERAHGLFNRLKQHGTATLCRFAALNRCDYHRHQSGMLGIGPAKANEILETCGIDDAAIKDALMAKLERQNKLTGPEIDALLCDYDRVLDCYLHQVIYSIRALVVA
eukprot:TRINITY_DN43996_c0_g1_i1.p1 TRINITY_DN43996_c0_g1~~TRINITY_DN43996_c0_g1_i1.p1  ORF type:complete len:307 (+),score=35.70 TRINITY_DN43996_c0_g1_i1:26-946(+)